MKRVLVLILLALLLAGSLSAQKLELYYYKQEIQAGLKSLTDAFTAENPGITISLLIVPNDADATMSARAAAGTLPEILQMQSYSRVFEYAQKGYVLDLSKEPVMSKVIDSSKAGRHVERQAVGAAHGLRGHRHHLQQGHLCPVQAESPHDLQGAGARGEDAEGERRHPVRRAAQGELVDRPFHHPCPHQPACREEDSRGEVHRGHGRGKDELRRGGHEEAVRPHRLLQGEHGLQRRGDVLERAAGGLRRRQVGHDGPGPVVLRRGDRDQSRSWTAGSFPSLFSTMRG